MVHQKVGEYSKIFLQRLRRNNYVTPKNYLDFINSYLRLLEEKDKYILAQVSGGFTFVSFLICNSVYILTQFHFFPFAVEIFCCYQQYSWIFINILKLCLPGCKKYIQFECDILSFLTLSSVFPYQVRLLTTIPAHVFSHVFIQW